MRDLPGLGWICLDWGGFIGFVGRAANGARRLASTGAVRCAAVPGRRDSRTLRPRRLRTKQAEAATRSGVFWPVVSGSKSRFCARGRARSGSAAVPGRPPSAGLRRTGSNVRAERPRRLNAKTCSEKPAGTIRHDQAGFGAIRWFFDKKVLTTDEHR
jgi:hypothetical protein